MRDGCGRKGRRRGRGTACGAIPTSLLLVRIVVLEVECAELCFSLRGIVLCDVAGAKYRAASSEGVTPEAYGTVRLALG